jgi:hypothetical protein
MIFMLVFRATPCDVVPCIFAVDSDLCEHQRGEVSRNFMLAVIKGGGRNTNQTTQCSYPSHCDAAVGFQHIPINIGDRASQ